ncbi:uroporphyrinogen-III synthase [Thalassovita aquimarina]|uniref:Uroporphyrinogen-III synthase n=1 Tax=Thalassovita aquimarina TaxID=2785917 RepID=A0ABS5HN86_9RHOB|nr:uroporphyrinogen-III synthase [Thalassovita aquimarina]MBR9650384.1 uroporphyrinogen-III synthase [Thalassovita aquimarina]
MATLLLTRPLASSQRFAAQLRQRLGDVPMMISPLLQIDPVGRAPDLAGARAVIFTSQNALLAVAEGQGMPCYAVGSATADAARAAGFDPIAVERNAEDLFQRIMADHPSGPLLHLHGRHARGRLAERLTDAGIETREEVVYEQRETPLSTVAETLLRGEQTVIVPLFSPRSAKIFARQHVGQAPLFIAAMSDAVIEALGTLPVRRVERAQTPDATAMIAAIERLMAAG